MNEKRPQIAKGFPERLKQIRQSRGWSQGQVAKKIEADVQQISKYERGVIFPTVDMMLRLAKAMGVSLDYLLCGEDEIDLSKIPNQELAKRFESVGQLPDKEQEAIIIMIDALVKKHQAEEVFQK